MSALQLLHSFITYTIMHNTNETPYKIYALRQKSSVRWTSLYIISLYRIRNSCNITVELTKRKEKIYGWFNWPRIMLNFVYVFCVSHKEYVFPGLCNFEREPTTWCMCVQCCIMHSTQTISKCFQNTLLGWFRT